MSIEVKKKNRITNICRYIGNNEKFTQSVNPM